MVTCLSAGWGGQKKGHWTGTWTIVSQVRQGRRDPCLRLVDGAPCQPNLPRNRHGLKLAHPNRSFFNNFDIRDSTANRHSEPRFASRTSRTAHGFQPPPLTCGAPAVPYLARVSQRRQAPISSRYFPAIKSAG